MNSRYRPVSDFTQVLEKWTVAMTALALGWQTPYFATRDNHLSCSRIMVFRGWCLAMLTAPKVLYSPVQRHKITRLERVSEEVPVVMSRAGFLNRILLLSSLLSALALA